MLNVKSQADIWFDQAQQQHNNKLKQRLQQALIKYNRDVANSKASTVQQWLNKLNPVTIDDPLLDFQKGLTVEYLQHIEHLVCVEHNLDHPDVLHYNKMYGDQMDNETFDSISELNSLKHHTY